MRDAHAPPLHPVLYRSIAVTMPSTSLTTLQASVWGQSRNGGSCGDAGGGCVGGGVLPLTCVVEAAVGPVVG